MRNPAQGGASASLVSDTEASTPKAADTQSHAVDIFAPWAGEDERALRIRIHHARDLAQARACRSKHGRARTAYWIACQLGGDWVFQRASVDQLQEIIKGLTWLFLFASLIERVEASDG